MRLGKISVIMIVLLIIFSTMTAGCFKKPPATIRDIAYDINKRYGYTVYLKEETGYIPYLVLTADNNGNTLLLRKELLKEDHIYNPDGMIDGAYYKDSAIDQFLNDVFIKTLDSKTQNAILDTDVVITAKSSIGGLGQDTEIISCKSFLLSVTEIGMYEDGISGAKEGNALAYFKDSIRRIAYRGDEAFQWWLRSPNANDDNALFVIYPNGALGYISISTIFPRMPSNMSGVRPAFCLSNTTPIELRSGVVEGKDVYTLKLGGAG